MLCRVLLGPLFEAALEPSRDEEEVEEEEGGETRTMEERKIMVIWSFLSN